MKVNKYIYNIETKINNSPFFVSSIYSILIDPSISRMRDARGLTLEFGLFFLYAFDGTRQFDPFWRCLYLCVVDTNVCNV